MYLLFVSVIDLVQKLVEWFAKTRESHFCVLGRTTLYYTILSTFSFMFFGVLRFMNACEFYCLITIQKRGNFSL